MKDPFILQGCVFVKAIALKPFYIPFSYHCRYYWNNGNHFLSKVTVVKIIFAKWAGANRKLDHRKKFFSIVRRFSSSPQVYHIRSLWRCLRMSCTGRIGTRRVSTRRINSTGTQWKPSRTDCTSPWTYTRSIRRDNLSVSVKSDSFHGWIWGKGTPTEPHPYPVLKHTKNSL